MDSEHNATDSADNDLSSSGINNLTMASQQSTSITPWKPHDNYFAILISMGISPVLAKKALYYTHNTSAESAIEWIFNQDDTIDKETPLELELQMRGGDGGMDANMLATSATNVTNDDLFKMVFIVNAELSMGVGKIAAQVAHAALGLHRILLQHQIKYGESLLNWTEYGETKIVLRGNTTQHLIDLERKAMALDLPCYLVHDAGKTQVKSGSTTVLAVFGSNKQVDQVSGELKLY